MHGVSYLAYPSFDLKNAIHVCPCCVECFTTSICCMFVLGIDYIVATTKLITGQTLLQTMTGVPDKMKLIDGPMLPMK